MRFFKGFIRLFKGFIRPFKSLIRPFKGLIRPLKGGNQYFGCTITNEKLPDSFALVMMHELGHMKPLRGSCKKHIMGAYSNRGDFEVEF